MFRKLLLVVLVRLLTLNVVKSNCTFYHEKTHMFCAINCLNDILQYSDLPEVKSVLINMKPLKDSCKPLPLHWLDRHLPKLTQIKIRSQSCPFNSLFTNLKLETLYLSHYVEGKEFEISHKDLANSKIILDQPELAEFAISLCWPLLPRRFNLPKLRKLYLYGDIPEVHINGVEENLAQIKNVRNFSVNIYAPVLEKIVMKYQSFLYHKTLANIDTLKHFEYTGKNVEIIEADFLSDLPNLNLVDVSGKVEDELESKESLCKNLGAKNIRRIMFEGNVHNVCTEIFRCDNCTRDYYDKVDADEMKRLEISEEFERTQTIIGIMTSADPIPVMLNTSSLITFHDAANMNLLLRQLPSLDYLSILLRRFPRTVDNIVYENLRNIERLQIHVTICDRDGIRALAEFIANLTKLSSKPSITSHCSTLECSSDLQKTIEKSHDAFDPNTECSGTSQMAKSFITLTLIFSIFIHIIR